MDDAPAIALLQRLQSLTDPDLLPDLQPSGFASTADRISKTIGLPVDASAVFHSVTELKLPTSSQNPLTYRILHDAIRELQTTLESSDLQEIVPPSRLSPDQFPVYGTVTMGDFSAQIKGMGADSKPLMLFSDGLFGFANLIGKIVADALPMVSNENGYTYSCEKEIIQKNLRSNNLLIVRFIDLMLAYLLTNDPHASKPYIIDREHFHLAEIIRDSLEYFVVAHEYSHWALGHLSGATQRGSLNLNRLPTDTVLFNWKTEIEADALAGLLTIGTMQRQGCDLLLGSMGIWVCFHVLETIEKLQSLLPEEMPPRNFSETHPPHLSPQIRVYREISR